jgi:hypothetical protein
MTVEWNDLEGKLDIPDIPIAIHAPDMHLSYDLDIVPMGFGYLIEYACPEEVDLLDRYVLAARMNAGRRPDQVTLL